MSDRRVDLVHIGYIGPWPILSIYMMSKLHPQFGHPTFEQQHSIWTLDWIIILDVTWTFMTSMRFWFNIVFSAWGYLILYSIQWICKTGKSPWQMVAVTAYNHIIGLPPRRQTFESQMGLLFLVWLRYVVQPICFLKIIPFFFLTMYTTVTVKSNN